ncbi:MAG: glycosyltransferase [Gammaproteobacteria bacterium]|nr:glycosyltransferase [Gammaproteobacteria bacterium]
MRKYLLKLALRLENSWQPVRLEQAPVYLQAGWYVSEFLLQGALQATPRIVVRDQQGVVRERSLTGCHSGRNRMLFYLPAGEITGYSENLQFSRLARVSTLEGRARIGLICGRYLVDFFSFSVLVRMLIMQFQSPMVLCDELLHFYEPRQDDYLKNIDAWQRYRGYGKLIGWFYRRTRIAVLIEHESQRALLEDLLLPPDYILVAGESLPGDADYLLPLSRSERLRFPALLMIKQRLRKLDAQVTVVYSDHDYQHEEGADGDILHPVFKPQPSLAYLYCYNFIGPAVMFATSQLRGSDIAALLSDEGRYRMAIKCLQDKAAGLHVDEVLFVSDRLQGPATPAPEAVALPWADVRWQRRDNYNFLTAQPGWQPQPSVDLLIPTRDGLTFLQPCIESILDKTDYQNYRIIIIDNGSEQAATHAYFANIEQHPQITVVQYPGEFNFSAINNFGAAQGSGEYIGLINNDIEVIHADWLSQMMVWAKQDSVGIVGAKLLFGDGKVQHAGVTIGMGNAAGHIHRLEEGDAPGYQLRCLATQNMMAVTAACLITPRQLYQQLGGLNEIDFAVAYNDIDYCLRVEQMGLDIIWTPEARLYHHESVSRGDDLSAQHIERYFAELAALQKRWRTKGFVDKYYSRHLRISDEGVFPQMTRTAQDPLVLLSPE